MRELIKHGGTYGKPMKIQPERELRQNQPEKEEQEDEEDEEIQPEPEKEESENSLAPQMRIVDGKLVLDEESLVVTHTNKAPTHENYDIVLESNAVINSLSFSKFKPTERWGREDTDKFYRALQQVGADFSLVAKLFPNRTRRQIRNKFKKEEKENRSKVDWALLNRIPIDWDEITNAVESKPDEDEDKKYLQGNEDLMENIKKGNLTRPETPAIEETATTTPEESNEPERVIEEEERPAPEESTSSNVVPMESVAELGKAQKNILDSLSKKRAPKPPEPAVIVEDEYKDPFAM